MKICKTFILILLLIAANSLHAGDEETNKNSKKEILKLLETYRSGEALSKEAYQKIYPYLQQEKTPSPLYRLSPQQSTVYFSEDFSDGVLPAGWSNVDNVGNGEIWEFDDPGGRGEIQTTTGYNGFAIFDSDNYGNNGNPEDADLITPPLDFSDAVAVKLSFEHFFESSFGGVAEVSVSNDNGATWFTIAHWENVNTEDGQKETFDITAQAAGHSQVLVRWKWTGNWGYFWAVDDVLISSAIFDEMFSGGSLPAGWSIVDHAGIGEVWQFNNPGEREILTGSAANGFAIFDSDFYNFDTPPEDCDLISPAIDCSGAANVILSFEHLFQSGFGGKGELSVSSDDGATWSSLAVWQDETTANPQLEFFDLTAIAAGKSQVRLKWNWTGNWSRWWAIDDITLSDPAGGLLFSTAVNVDFGYIQPGESATETVYLTNGGLALNILSVLSNMPAFTVSNVPGQIPPAGTASFDITFTPPAIGPSSGEITITHDGLTGSEPLVITVEGTGFSVPQIDIPWNENFMVNSFSFNNWDISKFRGSPRVIDRNGVLVPPYPYSLPSEPYMMDISGKLFQNQDVDVATTGLFDLSDKTTVLLSFWKSEQNMWLGQYVLVSYLADDGSWRTLDSLPGNNYGAGNYRQFDRKEYLLPADAYHQAFQLRFSASDDMTIGNTYLFDNIQLAEGFPPPANLVGNPRNQAVDLSWEPPPSLLSMIQKKLGLPGSATREEGKTGKLTIDKSMLNLELQTMGLIGYPVYRSTDGFNFTAIDTVDATETTFSDSNLVNETTYYYYVTALVDDEESNPSNIVELKPFKIPFNTILFESFEDVNFPPANWQKYNQDGGTVGWSSQTIGTTPIPGWGGGIVSGPPNGGARVAFNSWNTGGSNFNDQWLITPQITGVEYGDSLHFWIRNWPFNYIDSVDVRISTTGITPSDFNTIVAELAFGQIVDTITTWRKYSFSIGDKVPEGSDIYIAFREHVVDNIYYGSSISLDLVSYTRLMSPVSRMFASYLNGNKTAPTPVATVGSGTGKFVLNGDQTVLSYEIAVRHLSGEITAAHFHNAPAGQNGGVVKTIYSGTPISGGSTFSGEWTSSDGEALTPELVSELLNGNIYVNIHSTLHGSGEIRGQLGLPEKPLKLLITEFTVSPTENEFIEIYNPNDTPVRLENYYLTDATLQNGNTYYYQIVEGGGGGGGFDDFHARFPSEAVINPGEYQTIALAGDQNFENAFGITPTYELFEDSSTVTTDAADMREAFPGSVNQQGGLTNSDEVIVLYYWDGLSDLVQDVDYIIYEGSGGSINEQVDKSGVSIDGPDADNSPTAYLDDTPIAVQVSAPGPETGFAAHRIDFTEGTQNSGNGNGISGADETSEDLNNTFIADRAPTPNAPPPATLSLNAPLHIRSVAQNSKVKLDWQRPFPPGELAYDDNTVELDLGFDGVTGQMAVRFKPNIYPATLVGIKTYWVSSGAAPRDVQYSVWKNVASGQFPPHTRILDYTNYAINERGNFTTIDLPTAVTITEGDFFISWSQIDTLNYKLGADENGSNLFRAWWSNDGVNWFNLNDFYTANLMIRALVVEGAGKNSRVMELKPTDISATDVTQKVKRPLPQILDRRLIPTAATTTQNLGNLQTGSSQQQKLNSNPSGLTGYKIWRSEDGFNFNDIAVLDTSSQTYFDSDVTLGTTYWYTINAIYGDNQSSWGNLTKITAAVASEATFDHLTSRYMSSVTNEGSIGFLNDNPEWGGTGSGFRFNPSTASGQRLYYGGIAVATDADHVSDAAWDDDLYSDADFQIMSHIEEIVVPGVRAEAITSYSDALAENPIGVTITQRTISNNAGLSQFSETFELTVTNTSGINLTDVYVGAFVDWDASLDFADRGQVIIDSLNFIPTVNGDAPFPFEVMEQHNNLNPDAWLGIVPLSSNVFAGRRILNYDAEINNGLMTNASKWAYMTTYRDGNPNGDIGFGDDHAQMFGLPPVSIPPDSSVTLGFALVAGRSETDLLNVARRAQFDWVLELGNKLQIDSPLGINNDPETDIPATYSLEQNYPNPFNPSTRLKYSLKESGRVRLQVFNVLGQLVRILVDSDQTAGYKEVMWDGKNHLGEKVSSGIYIYRIEVNEFVNTRKMILLK
ncbi:MAG: choice-of-anchor J domain-containing protein [Calditrichae bacterium]|nr:choice-of-anchor J domain-containing protein [Calditrichia bacterium]